MLHSLIWVVDISDCRCWDRERLDLPAVERDGAYRKRWISRVGRDGTGADGAPAQRAADGKACERCSRSVKSCPSSWEIGCLRLR